MSVCLVIKFKLSHNSYILHRKSYTSMNLHFTSLEIRITTLTFGNDDKSHQNKSHNEITVQLCAKVA